jgi:hypothetical protein
MNITTMIFSGIVMYLVIAFMLWRVHSEQPRLMRRIAGSILCDAGLHALVILVVLGSGSIQGLIAAEIAGIGYSITLSWYRKAYGFEKYTDFTWKRFAGYRTGEQA